MISEYALLVLQNLEFGLKHLQTIGTERLSQKDDWCGKGRGKVL